jgi:elongation factor Ts
MAEITAALVKELRERTGEGMMDCKKALTKAGGDIEKAIDDMRASGAIKAAKKAGNVAAEGAIAIKADDKSAVLLEVNSQTDFLALQDDFKNFVAESLCRETDRRCAADRFPRSCSRSPGCQGW